MSGGKSAALNYDYYAAGKKCLLILTGLGGDIKGYNNKYTQIARNVSRKFGYSVVVVGVPHDCWSRPQQVFEGAIDCVLRSLDCEEIYVMGSSAGATIALWFAHMWGAIAKVLAVNPVLNLNIHRTREGIEKFSGEKLVIVNGEYDPCAMWQGLLPEKPNVYRHILSGADHVFSGNLAEFIALPEKFLFG